MTKDERALLRAIDAANRSDERWAARIEKMRKALKCSHPVTESYQWEHDNGYGGQSMNTGLICTLCGAKRPYGMDMGTWIRPEDYTSNDS